MMYFASIQDAQPATTSSTQPPKSTPKPPKGTTTASINGNDRELITAIFNFESKILELKWSDQTTRKVKLTPISVPNCFYKGSFKVDPDSAILLTGCENELQSLQIQR